MYTHMYLLMLLAKKYTLEIFGLFISFQVILGCSLEGGE